jgi:hypothetical protein
LRVAIFPVNVRNPLKSPDSEEGILGNERNFKPQMKGKPRKSKGCKEKASKTKICAIHGAGCGLVDYRIALAFAK